MWYSINYCCDESEADITEREHNRIARGITLWKVLILCCIGFFAGVVSEIIRCILIQRRFETRPELFRKFCKKSHCILKFVINVL